MDGLVVAAGFSSRMGHAHKLLLKIDGRTVIERSVSTLLPFCDRLVVVTGHRGDEVSEALWNLPRVETVFHSGYRDGMLGSVLAGVRRLGEGACLFLPGDHPFVDPAVVVRMLAQSSDLLIPRYRGTPGHPVLLGRPVLDRLLSSAPPTSLREFLQNLGPTYLDVDDPGILEDIDTPEDFRRALGRIACSLPEETE